MMLAGGDMVQYKTIREGSIGDYLVKLDNYVQGIERQMNASKQQQKKK